MFLLTEVGLVLSVARRIQLRENFKNRTRYITSTVTYDRTGLKFWFRMVLHGFYSDSGWCCPAGEGQDSGL